MENLSEHYIPLPYQRIKRKLCSLHPDSEQFQLFCKLIKNSFHVETLHSCSKAENLLNTLMEHKDLPPDAEMVQQEQEFLQRIDKIMQGANYTLMSSEEWKYSVDDNFSILVPMEIDWDYLDKEMITEFLDRHPTLKDVSAFDSILFYKRGVGMSTRSDIFLWEKIDLLLEMTVIKTIRDRIYVPLAAKFGVEIPEEPKKIDKIWKNVETGEEITRLTFRSQLQTPSDIFAKFYKTITIHEPNYKDLIVIFREKDQPNDRGDIHITSYQDLPLGDVQGIFPKTEMGIRNSDKIWIYAMLAIGLFATVTSLLFNHGYFDFLIVVALVGVKLYQSYISSEISKTQSRAQVTDSLYKSFKGDSSIVIRDSFNSFEKQEMKELLIAYFVISQSNGLSMEEITTEAESFLHDLNAYVSFEVEDAIRKLTEHDLVELQGNKYITKDLSTCCDLLKAKWSAKFQ